MPTDDMTLEKALALVREIGDSLGGDQARACTMVCRVAERAGKRTTGRMEAVGAAAFGTQHFAKATADLRDVKDRVVGIEEALTAGLAAVQESSRAIAAVELDERGLEARGRDPRTDSET